MPDRLTKTRRVGKAGLDRADDPRLHHLVAGRPRASSPSHREWTNELLESVREPALATTASCERPAGAWQPPSSGNRAFDEYRSETLEAPRGRAARVPRVPGPPARCQGQGRVRPVHGRTPQPARAPRPPAQADIRARGSGHIRRSPNWPWRAASPPARGRRSADTATSNAVLMMIRIMNGATEPMTRREPGAHDDRQLHDENAEIEPEQHRFALRFARRRGRPCARRKTPHARAQGFTDVEQHDEAVPDEQQQQRHPEPGRHHHLLDRSRARCEFLRDQSPANMTHRNSRCTAMNPPACTVKSATRAAAIVSSSRSRTSGRRPPRAAVVAMRTKIQNAMMAVSIQ